MTILGMNNCDIRIFWDNRSSSWIIANDNKMRRLLNQGYNIGEAKEKSHGHLNNKRVAYDMKENILANKKPKSRRLWVLKCYIRITDNRSYKHYKWTKGLYNTRKNKDNGYYINIPKK